MAAAMPLFSPLLLESELPIANIATRAEAI